MEVKRFVPAAGHPLEPYLDSIWRCQILNAPHTEIILPKGIVDIVFYLSSPAQVFSSKRITEPLPTYPIILSGLRTGTMKVKPQKEFYNIGISLKAETCISLLHLPSIELTDLAIDPVHIFRDVHILWEKLCCSPDFENQCSLLIQWLMVKLKPSEKEKLISHCCNYLQNKPLEDSLINLSRSLGISSRHLRRLFLQNVGVSPSQYIRLQRFIKSIYAIPNSSKSLTQIAHDVHYTDQAHFCHDFKDFAGMTPIEYKKGVNGVPGHIFL